MIKYTVRRANSFRYTKGRSLLRIMFSRAQKDSKIKTWSFTHDDNIDDPTGEIGRLKEKVFSMIVIYF